MKVLVLYKPNKKYDNFEGARMRKSIKGALELQNINHVDNKVDFFDVGHIISPNQDSEINEIHDNGAPAVVSALYAESDGNVSYLEKKPNEKKSSLTTKAFKFLNKADLVLVPCESAKSLLLNSGITSRVEVCYPGVNLTRFDFSKENETEIFYRYYREDKNKKLVLSVGEYDRKMEGINAFINAARKCPNAVFYYVGRYDGRTKSRLRFKKFFKKFPKNVHFVDVPPDDVYRSALLNASIFMVTTYKITGVTSLVEAMAAKAQIIARKSAIFEGFLEDGITAHMGEFSETLSSLVRDFLDGKIKPTTIQAYQQVERHHLTNFGEDLINYYQLAIQNNIHRRK